MTATYRQLTALLIALTIEFLLGVMLTTVVSYEPGSKSIAQSVILVLHVVLAAGILIGSIYRLIISIKHQSQLGSSLLGFLGILGAIASGLDASRTGSSTATFAMSVFFIIAFVAYGLGLVGVHASGRHSHSV